MDNEMDFNTALTNFITKLQEQVDNHYQTRFPTLVASVLTVEPGSKFARVVITSDGGKGQRSVHCFVAMQDGQSKALGSYKRGDIMRAASWKQPAKHSRGSIFADNWNGYGVTVYGGVYRR
jgi:hypothetical protein